MENTPEGKITPPAMSETFGNQAKTPVVEQKSGILEKLRGLFSRKKSQTPLPSAEPLQQKADAVQGRLNEVKLGQAVGTEGGIPTGDAGTIAELERKKGDLAALGVIPNVAPIESPRSFGDTKLPDFQKPGGTPATNETPESLAASVVKLTQADAKSEEATPIDVTSEKAA